MTNSPEIKPEPTFSVMDARRAVLLWWFTQEGRGFSNDFKVRLHGHRGEEVNIEGVGVFHPKEFERVAEVLIINQERYDEALELIKVELREE